MSNQKAEEFDVVVAGGGPGGSTLASLVAKQGHRVLVLEKERFPRYQIGESLLPATIHGILRLTGAADEVAKAGFTHKRGGTFRWGASKDPWTFAFSVSPRMSSATSFAYQVERSKFDKILLDNARSAGADVREQCAAASVIEDGDRVTGVTYTGPDGSTRQALGKWVVDASGNKSRLYTSVGGKRQYSDFFRSLALFGYFAGGKRMPEPLSGNIYCVAFESGWFWYIPLADDLTSVGAVVSRENASKVQGDPEKALTGLIQECPEVEEMLEGVERITTGQYGHIRVRKDYSYYNTEFWRPGMILVGDAACFVDPVFSSGVHLATYGALLAARSINSMLAGIVDEKAALREFDNRYRREYSVFYEFLTSFYELHEDENSYFWNAKKVINSSHNELEAFVDLVGGVSSGESALTGAEDAKQRFREKSADFATAIGNLASINSSSMVPLFKAGVVKQVMEESGQIQMRAILGEEAEPETPMAPDGLIASPDGMFWVDPQQVSAAQGTEAGSGR
jgi:FAD-dependent halogenase